MRLSDRVDKMETKLAAQSKTQSQSVGVEQSGDENETGSKLTDNQVGPSYFALLPATRAWPAWRAISTV